MERHIVDVPRVLYRGTLCNWRIDWRGQAPLQATDGSEQVVFNRFPRFIGQPEMVLPPEMIGEWRALVGRLRGRSGALRMRMLDRAVQPGIGAAAWQSMWRAYRAGLYVEPRLVIRCVTAASAGDGSIVVDETGAPDPVRVGCFLSYQDWPFLVVGRSGVGASVVLTVEMLRVDIPVNADIDLVARGLFTVRADDFGWPEYGLDLVARPQLDLVEWITR